LDFFVPTFKDISKKPKIISWKKISWYNIHDKIIFNEKNLVHPLFHKVQDISEIQPNPLDRSLWRIQDYKNEMKNLKKTYAQSGDLKLSKCFKQVNFILK